MKNYGVLLLLMFLLNGCSTTTVHLYGKYLTNEQQQQVITLLANEDVVVEVNHLDFPELIHSSAIIYSPFVANPNVVSNVKTALEPNWPINYISALKEGHHWFQQDTLGLFLVPEGVNPHSGQNLADLSLRYLSKKSFSENSLSKNGLSESGYSENNLANDNPDEHCQSQLSLDLQRDGRYQFSDEIKDQSYSFGRLGYWRIRAYPYIELKPKNNGRWLYFEVEQLTETDQLGEVKLVKLVPMESYPGLGNCQFIFGERK
ncbi:hypothetical protein [Colwellia sp. MEBiC06753]